MTLTEQQLQKAIAEYVNDPNYRPPTGWQEFWCLVGIILEVILLPVILVLDLWDSWMVALENWYYSAHPNGS